MIGYVKKSNYMQWRMLKRLWFHPVTALGLGNVPGVFKSCRQTGEIIHLDPHVIVNFVYKHLPL